MVDGFIIRRGGNKRPNKTLCGCELLTQTKEGFQKWVTLKDIKGSNPVYLTDYEVENKIDKDP